MKTFLSYFDLLGYKEFILNNEISEIRRRVKHILRDIELSLGQGEFKETYYGSIADINLSGINTLNISDTIIFWTNDDSLKSFKELLKVSYDFNWRLTRYHFPLRGAIYYDEFQIISGFQKTDNGGSYNVNSIFGKGLVFAHLKAENLNFAGCVIDDTVINKIAEIGEIDELIGDYAIRYKVPYKNGENLSKEYVLKLFIDKTINQETLINSTESIKLAFTGDNKPFTERAEILFNNTIEFLGYLKE